MRKPIPQAPRQATDRAVRPSDSELLARLWEGEWRDDLLDDLGDRDEVLQRLFAMALGGLKRTNALADEMVVDQTRHRREFEVWLATHRASQTRTQAMIEELVNGR